MSSAVHILFFMTKAPMVNVKELIQRICETHNWNQKELAYKLNIKPETISRWMNERNTPSRRNIQRLQNYLGENIENSIIRSEIDNTYKLSIGVNMESDNVNISIDNLNQGDIADVLSSLIRKITKKGDK